MRTTADNTTAMATTSTDITNFGVDELEAANHSGGGKFDPVSEGRHAARFVDVIDLGESAYDKDSEPRRQFLFVLASDERQLDEEGKDIGPRYLSHYVSASLFPGTTDFPKPSKHMTMLRQVFGRPNLTPEDLRGKYTLGKMLGISCGVVVVHQESGKGRTYGKIARFSKATEEDERNAPKLADYVRPAWVLKKMPQAPDEATAAALGALDGTPDPQPEPQPEPQPQPQLKSKRSKPKLVKSETEPRPDPEPRELDDDSVPF